MSIWLILDVYDSIQVHVSSFFVAWFSGTQSGFSSLFSHTRFFSLHLDRFISYSTVDQNHRVVLIDFCFVASSIPLHSMSFVFHHFLHFFTSCHVCLFSIQNSPHMYTSLQNCFLFFPSIHNARNRSRKKHTIFLPQ